MHEPRPCESIIYPGADGLMGGGDAGGTLQAVLVHNPVGLEALGGAPTVEDQRLLHANPNTPAVHHLPVLARGLPVPLLRGPVGPHSRGVLPVTHTEEVPFVLPHLRLLCSPRQQAT